MARSKTPHTRPCTVDGCKGVIGDNSITGLCPNCYSSLLGWGKKNIRDKVQRANRLNLYVNRLMYLLPDDKIQMLTTRKKYTPIVVMPGQVKKYRKKSKYKTVSRNRIIVGGH